MKNNWRSNFMLIFLFLLLSTLIIRTGYLQLYDKEFLQKKGEARYARTLVLPYTRGKILDRNGDILAMSLKVKSIWAIPIEVKKLKEEELIELSNILNIKLKELKTKLEINSNFVYLKRQVEPEISKLLEEKKYLGIYEEQSYKRYYPANNIMSHITGFVDIEENGQEGLELVMNDKLKGINGERRIIKNRRGEVVEELQPNVEPKNGEDISLSIDSKIQYFTYAALKEAVDKYKTKAGSAIVLDAKSGEILSLVNLPDYNPNNRSNLTGEKLRNRAIIDLYEPGSIMKPFPIALALEKNIVNEDTMFNTKEVKIGKKSIKDAHAHADLTVSQIIQKSSNIGTVKIAMKLTPEELWGLFNNVGFGNKLNIEFPGEAKGIVRDFKKWKPIEQATMSFGHGISVNLLQMAHAYLIFTNNGEINNISLIKNKENQKNKTTRIISEKTAKKLQLMLESVTQKEGTAFLAQTPSFRVAGKTGTANKLKNGRYVNQYIASFVGFAPVSNPKLIVAVMLDEPKVNGYYGGVVAAPVFSKITEKSLNYLNIQKDK